MEHRFDLAVVVDTYGENAKSITPFIEEILNITRKAGEKTHVLPVMHKTLEPKWRELISGLEEAFPNKITGIAVDHLKKDDQIVQERSYALAYLEGLKQGAKIADKVIEIDSGGSHNPQQISRFLKALEKHDIVFSSRFIKGAANKYPIQRQLTSLGVTILSNLFLETNLSDAASGFEAFRKEPLQDLFKALPAEDWFSVIYGPLHMYQTEIRAYLSWQNEYSRTIVPISYGEGRIGKSFPVNYLVKSLACFYQIWKEKSKRQMRISQVFI